MESDKIKVFVIDASEIWRKILVNHITSAPDMEAAGETTSGQGGVLLLEGVDPDVVMLDVSEKDRIPPEEIIAQLKRVKSQIQIILCADQQRADYVVKATDKGAYDFVTKPYKRENVLRLIRECYNQLNA